jgi:phenylalanyl-tRNA synthetase beta chain
MTTLDGEDHEIDTETLLITDGVSVSVLALAGIKGGKMAEVDRGTVNIIIESANFDPTHVRNTSRRLKLRTDASMRFENEPPKDFTVCALESVAKLIIKVAGGEVEGVVDVYPQEDESIQVSVTVDDVNRLLGSSLVESDIKNIFDRFGFSYTEENKNFVVSVPYERPDITIKEDLIEEIGRVHGYANIKPDTIKSAEKKPKLNKRFYYSELVRSFLREKSFSEVYTYGLRESGKVRLINPLASDKAFMRESLHEGLASSLELNKQNAPLLGLEIIKVFEIGTVFEKDREFAELGIGILPLVKKNREEIQKNSFAEIKEGIESLFGIQNIKHKEEGGIALIDLDALIKDLSEPTSYSSREEDRKIVYKVFSSYPFALRDISVWTPQSTKSEEVLAVVEKEAGGLLVNYSLFDTFEKDGKVSFAFHLVFQSQKKTLSEDELTSLMDRIYGVLKGKEGWDIR